MKPAWLGLALLSASWLFGLSYYEPANMHYFAAITAAGSLLLIASADRIPRSWPVVPGHADGSAGGVVHALALPGIMSGSACRSCDGFNAGHAFRAAGHGWWFHPCRCRFDGPDAGHARL